eukprot:NODE_1535_length_1382_cov_9.263316_g1276_i0.p1 GENE.NODE_1535_length_1382_cov_9.263316_g1276_i0~~NODE_1535_length_1382_cov_9.263316_g1276_i0.p1  ORF type:complete len:351 (-),score=26.54 NODE_1535_length_1382_cov_9.263316_g1276_i0:118-1170(-)
MQSGAMPPGFQGTPQMSGVTPPGGAAMAGMQSVKVAQPLGTVPQFSPQYVQQASPHAQGQQRPPKVPLNQGGRPQGTASTSGRSPHISIPDVNGKFDGFLLTPRPACCWFLRNKCTKGDTHLVYHAVNKEHYDAHQITQSAVVCWWGRTCSVDAHRRAAQQQVKALGGESAVYPIQPAALEQAPRDVVDAEVEKRNAAMAIAAGASITALQNQGMGAFPQASQGQFFSPLMFLQPAMQQRGPQVPAGTGQGVAGGPPAAPQGTSTGVSGNIAGGSDASPEGPMPIPEDSASFQNISAAAPGGPSLAATQLPASNFTQSSEDKPEGAQVPTATETTPEPAEAAPPTDPQSS